MTWCAGLRLSGLAPVASLSFTSLVSRSGLVHPFLWICPLRRTRAASIGVALVASLCSSLHPRILGIYASVERGQIHPLICISCHIPVENHVASLLRGTFKGIRSFFALIFVSCNAIPAPVLLAKHLPLHVCVLVGRKILPLVALTASLFLPVASAAKSFFNVAVIAVSKSVIWVLVILVKFQSMPLAFVPKRWR